MVRQGRLGLRQSERKLTSGAYIDGILGAYLGFLLARLGYFNTRVEQLGKQFALLERRLTARQDENSGVTDMAMTLAVLQNSRTFAALASAGGFLAPVLMSSGSGNHVGLFSYYAILNSAIFAVAWLKSWRLLNLIGFVFTFAIGLAWG
ncbi:MAG: hypothetical protein ACI9Y1_003191 [Lentisphaeria bacterium]